MTSREFCWVGVGSNAVTAFWCLTLGETGMGLLCLGALGFLAYRLATTPSGS